MTSKGIEGEIDFSDQIKQAAADELAGYPPNCNKGYEAKDGKCVKIVEDKAKDKGEKDSSDKKKNGDKKSGDKKSGDKKSGDKKNDDKKNGDEKNGDEKGKDGKKLPPWLNKKKKK